MRPSKPGGSDGDQNQDNQAKQGKGDPLTLAAGLDDDPRRPQAAVVLPHELGCRYIDPINLGMQPSISEAAAPRCLAVWDGICTALREAELLALRSPRKRTGSAPTSRRRGA
jgi:hypothetical protein